MSARIERLEAELALAHLEEELHLSKKGLKKGQRAPKELRESVRAARSEFRNKYREQVNVNPASIGSGVATAGAKGTA